MKFTYKVHCNIDTQKCKLASINNRFLKEIKQKIIFVKVLPSYVTA